MRASMLFVALAWLPLMTFGKGETTRIEIAHGKHIVLTLTGPEEAGQFTIWSGPGTSTASADGTTHTPSGERDFADWIGGPVDPPRGLEVYTVRFYCAAAGEAARESVPSHLCYGVRYAFDGAGGRGYIQIPRARDREFPDNTHSIYRGVEGSWYRAAPGWDAVVGAKLHAAREARLQAELEAARRNDHLRRQRYYQPQPGTRAVGATPKVTPKSR
jgi:hypothetical protein